MIPHTGDIYRGGDGRERVIMWRRDGIVAWKWVENGRPITRGKIRHCHWRHFADRDGWWSTAERIGALEVAE